MTVVPAKSGSDYLRLKVENTFYEFENNNEAKK